MIDRACKRGGKAPKVRKEARPRSGKIMPTRISLVLRLEVLVFAPLSPITLGDGKEDRQLRRTPVPDGLCFVLFRV